MIGQFTVIEPEQAAAKPVTSDQTFTAVARCLSKDGKVYVGEITVGGKPPNMVCEWSPRTPRNLSPLGVQTYRNTRDALLKHYADVTGGKVLLVE